ncbi:helicase RepA family protein [Methylobacterium sp. J-068]|uniref:helicase RepA family protein n=1 Tax=Methylobacterium sp. J-068 TaxID=2836649 RepID=UPI001FBAEE45|nr:helicase RepA family protein [Methylobacterium sp. J-068]MCJ2036388.1 helicase RepA family protein [Methylobacterium sp. J-068]
MALSDGYNPAEDFGRRPFVPPYHDDPDGSDRFGAGHQVETPLRIRATPFACIDPRTIPPRRWLYGRHYIRRYVTATIAPGGLGKSSLALVEALAMVTGRNLLASPVKEPLRVWYWNGEDPREEVERRLAAACLHYGITTEDIGGRLFIDSGRDLPLKIATRQRDAIAVAKPLVDELVREIQARGIDQLILDPFVACHDVPENDNGAVDRVAKEWGGIGERGNCGVEFVHHVRKAGNGQTSYSVEDARGGSALIGAVRSARVLNAMSPEEASQAGIEADQRRRYFRVDDGKANMQPPGDSASWHHLVSVELGNDTADAPGDRVGVVTAWTLPGLLDQISIDHVRAVQTAVDAGEWSDSVQAENWVGYAVANVLRMSPKSDEADKGRIKKYLKTWLKGGALRQVSIYDTKKARNRTFIQVGDRV